MMFIVYRLYITLIETVFRIFPKFKFSAFLQFRLTHESLSLNSGLVQYHTKFDYIPVELYSFHVTNYDCRLCNFL